MGTVPGAVALVGDHVVHVDAAAADVAALDLAIGDTEWRLGNGLPDGACAIPVTADGQVDVAKHDSSVCRAP